MKIRPKTETIFEELDDEDRPKPFSAFSDSLDVYQFIAQIHSRINKDISSDFVLASLDSGDKEFIIEMVSNAYFVKKIMLSLQLGEKEEKNKLIIRRFGEDVFDAYANKLYMVAALNRNVTLNPLLRLMAGLSDIHDEEKKEKDENKLTKWIKDRLKKEED